MSLIIERFITRCQVASQAPAAQPLVDRIIRERFADECAQRLEPRWTAQPGVVRIRRLRLRLRLTQAQLDGGRLTRAWVETFERALVAASACPMGTGPFEIVHAESRAEWLARFICDLLAGEAHGRWEYEEFSALLGLSANEAAIRLLSEEPDEIAPALMALERRDALDRALALFDELALERLFAAIARARGATQHSLSIEDLLAAGRLMIAERWISTDNGLALRRTALRVFLALDGVERRNTGWSPRRALSALIAIAAMLELTRSSDLTEWTSALSADSIARRFDRPLPAAVQELIERIRRLVEAHSPSEPRDALFQLSDLLAELAQFAPSGDQQKHQARQQAHWITSDCAGLFLVAGLLVRLGWPERIMRSSLGAKHGPRALAYSLAGLGLALTGEFAASPERLDPGVALFAGWVNDPDLAGLRRFLAEDSATERLELLKALVETLETTGSKLERRAESWPATFDHLAERLIRQFASRIRGFKQSSRPFVTKSFLAIPGRIRVDEGRILAQLAPSPFHVALRIASLDETVESLSWIEGRRLEFQLEGL